VELPNNDVLRRVYANRKQSTSTFLCMFLLVIWKKARIISARLGAVNL
jgi:hypothetical protein